MVPAFVQFTLKLFFSCYEGVIFGAFQKSVRNFTCLLEMKGFQKKKKIPQLIPSQSRYLIETDNLICAANQLTGSYMMGILNLNRLRGVSIL